MEWDRAAEELTWERLLGLDGSLVFLEHVFWVVSLNTLFIVVFGEISNHLFLQRNIQINRDFLQHSVLITSATSRPLRSS